MEPRVACRGGFRQCRFFFRGHVLLGRRGAGGARKGSVCVHRGRSSTGRSILLRGGSWSRQVLELSTHAKGVP